MGFGSTYAYAEPKKVLEDGDYEVTLSLPYETSVKGYAVLRFPFKIEGMADNFVPNSFDLFDVTDTNNREQVEMFNKRASRIKACFLLGGDFTALNYQAWAGGRGKVHIGKDKNGFTVVKTFYPHEGAHEMKALL